MRLLALVPLSLSDSVVDSQMKSTLKRISKSAVFYKTHFEKPSCLFKVLGNLAKMMRLMRDVDYIYVRSQLDFLFVYIIRPISLGKPKIWFDSRGVAPLEISLRNGLFTNSSFVFIAVDRFIFKRADYITCVSKGIEEYITTLAPARKSLAPIRVVPCVYGGQKTFSLINEDKNIHRVGKVCYVGSIAIWQRFDLVCEAIKILNDRVDCIEFGVVNNNPDDIINNSNFSDICSFSNVIALSHSEVVNYIKNFSIGIICRDNSLLNYCASPIKIAEYINAGLGVIVIGGWSSTVEMAIQKGFAVYFKDLATFKSFCFDHDQSTLLSFFDDLRPGQRSTDDFQYEKYAGLIADDMRLIRT